MFGCCSCYIECSNAGYCLHKSNSKYEGCYYRKNLEAGRNFYRTKNEYKIFLNCYNQSFAVLSRYEIWKSAVSYQLKPEQYEKVKKVFDSLSIPYIEELNNSNIKQQEKQICDCRVVIEVEGDKYHILNYNSYLIAEKKADGIRKAFEAKGIPARVEKVGRWSIVNIPPWKETTQTTVELELDRKPVRKTEVLYEQSSIFDLIGV